MSKIEVNEYVRTKGGEIGIFKGYNNNKNSQWKYKVKLPKMKLWKYYEEENIVKHSKQLIDLIEVGDIVEIRTGLHSSFKYFVENEDNLLLLEEKVKQFWNIKTILTKEQFEANCYKAGGEDE